ncbi:MAG: segregation/condensation protein A [Candidatus Micrarchaeia archaeon]
MIPSVEVYKGNLLDLEDFVQNATWRELLIHIVEKNQLDPWDINISEIADHYIKAVNRMKVLDLHIPANLILAVSILLRMKSEAFILVENSEVTPIEEIEGSMQRVIPDVEPLVSKIRMQPGKRITLQELMEAMDEAIKIQRSSTSTEHTARPPINITINTEDIDSKLDRVYDLVKKNIDGERITTFASLIRGFNNIESILLDLFIPLLLLMHRGKLALRQDEFFNEIFIMLKDGGNA